MMSGAFDYVTFDSASVGTLEHVKRLTLELEMVVEGALMPSRPRSLAMTSLEEFYMWIGKAIRDEQIRRGGSAIDVPERTNI